ncbi:MAG: hypothetical protein GX327_08010 [Epulopiscium sp.]|nr:hypothetical protein [Candidatus Epulonipiscium sp.]
MYGQKWRGRQKKIGVVLVTILIFSIVLGSVIPFIVYGDEKDKITIKAEVGFSSKYKIGGTTPVVLEITNEGEEFNGEIQINVLVANYSNVKEYVTYEIPINLPKGTTKKVTMNINPLTLQKYFYVTLVSNSKEVAKKIIYATPFEPERGFIGVLSDDIESLNYLKNIKIDIEKTQVVGNRLVELNTDNFPSDISIFDSFDLIIINDFDTSKLNDNQKESLKEWVLEGGVLVLGTGVNSSKVLKGFYNEFINIKDKGIISINDFSQMESITGKIFETESMDIVDFEIENGKGILFSDDIAISSLVNKNEGSIIIHHFDLGLNPMADWQGNSSLLTELYMNNVPDLVEVLMTNSYRNYDYRLNNYALRLFPRPSQSLLFILVALVIIIYIVASGPILYLILKYKDKREYGWFIIPLIAIVFSSIIYLMSSSSSIRNPVASSIGFVSLEEGENSGFMEVSLAVFTPKSGENRVEILKDISPKLSNYDYYYYYDNYHNTLNERVKVKINMGEKNKFTFYNSQSWEMNNISGKTIYNTSGPLNSSITLKDNKLVGTIENNLGFDLESCILVVGKNYYYIDRIKNNETIDIEKELASSFKSRYEIFDDIFGKSYDKKDMEEKWGKDIKAEDLQRIIQRRNIYEGYLDTMYNSMSYSVNNNTQASFGDNYIVLYGFNEEEFLEGVKINDKLVEHYKQNLFIIPLKLDYENTNYFEIPYGFLRPNIVSNAGYYFDSYDDSIWIHNSGDLDFNYILPKDINILEFQIQFTKINSIEEALIYNNAKGEWEELSPLAYSHNTNDYLNDEGTMKIRFKITIDNGQDAGIQIPYLRLKGDK